MVIVILRVDLVYPCSLQYLPTLDKNRIFTIVPGRPGSVREVGKPSRPPSPVDMSGIRENAVVGDSSHQRTRNKLGHVAAVQHHIWQFPDNADNQMVYDVHHDWHLLDPFALVAEIVRQTSQVIQDLSIDQFDHPMLCRSQVRLYIVQLLLQSSFIPFGVVQGGQMLLGLLMFE